MEPFADRETPRSIYNIRPNYHECQLFFQIFLKFFAQSAPPCLPRTTNHKPRSTKYPPRPSPPIPPHPINFSNTPNTVILHPWAYFFQPPKELRTIEASYSMLCAVRNIAFSKAVKNCWYGSGSSIAFRLYCAFARTSI